MCACTCVYIWCVCMACVYAHVCIYRVYVYIYIWGTCVYVNVETKGWCWKSSSVILYLIFWNIFRCTWSLAIQIVWQPASPQGSRSLFPSAGTTDPSHHTWLFKWVLGIHWSLHTCTARSLLIYWSPQPFSILVKDFPQKTRNDLEIKRDKSNHSTPSSTPILVKAMTYFSNALLTGGKPPQLCL